MNAFQNTVLFLGPALEHESQGRSLLSLVLKIAADGPDPDPQAPSTPDGVLKRLSKYDPSGKAVGYLRKALYSAVADVANGSEE
jgi:hypothetical protein